MAVTTVRPCPSLGEWIDASREEGAFHEKGRYRYSIRYYNNEFSPL